MAPRLRIGVLLSTFAAGAMFLAMSIAGTGSAAGVPGDFNCDGRTNSIDAAVILQYDAGYTWIRVCPLKGDANGDGLNDSLDATIILQYTAHLIPCIGTPTPTPPIGTPTNTPNPPPPPTPILGFGAAFSLVGQGCNTKGGSLVCETDFEIGNTSVAVYLDGLPEGVLNYRSLTIALVFGNGRAGYFTPELSGQEWTWPDCASPTSVALSGGRVELTCSIDPTASPSTYTGQVALVNYHFMCGGPVSLLHGLGNTTLGSGNASTVYIEAAAGSEGVTLHSNSKWCS